MPEMDVQIESISLNGVTGFDRDQFGAALSSELGRLVSADGAIGGLWQVAQVNLELPSQADSAAIGVQVARAIFAQINGRTRTW